LSLTSLRTKKQEKNKRVEGPLMACLDEGSIPSDSTITRNMVAILSIKSSTSFTWLSFVV